MAIPRYTRLTDEDYDRKLREMGNYLWQLEQEADLASQKGALKNVTTLYDAQTEATFVEIDRDGAAQGTVTVEGNDIIWALDNSKDKVKCGPGRDIYHVARSRKKKYKFRNCEKVDYRPESVRGGGLRPLP